VVALNANSLEWGAAVVALDGETESGDSYLVCASPQGLLIAAIDGLGHGAKAAAVSRLAIEVLERHATESIDSLLLRCHEALQPTRGATMSLAAFNTIDATLTWLGVGNVEGHLWRADRSVPDEKLLLRGGVVGLQLPSLQTTVHSLNRGDLLVFVTDGVSSDFARTTDITAATQAIAEQILAKGRKGNDDAMAIVVRYRGEES
jgi:negative regulator of sigma-B (phosphoserine phosphatase)